MSASAIVLVLCMVSGLRSTAPDDGIHVLSFARKLVLRIWLALALSWAGWSEKAVLRLEMQSL